MVATWRVVRNARMAAARRDLRVVIVRRARDRGEG